MRIGIYLDGETSDGTSDDTRGDSARAAALVYGCGVARALAAARHDVHVWCRDTRASSEAWTLHRLEGDVDDCLPSIASSDLDFLYADRASWRRLRDVVGAECPLLDCPVVDADFARALPGVHTSHFAHVERERRASNLEDLAIEPRGGKSAEQRAELRLRIEERDFEAMTAFRDAYERRSADVDALERLQSLDLHDADSRILLCVGPLTSSRGLHELLASLPDVFEDVRGSKLVVVGNGGFREVLEGLVHAIDTGDNRLWRFIRDSGYALDEEPRAEPFHALPELAPTFPGFEDRVLFVGHLDGPALHRVLEVADVFVQPDPTDVAHVLEAMACGVFPALAAEAPEFLAELETVLGAEVAQSVRLPRGATRVRETSHFLTRLLELQPTAQRGAELRRIARERLDWNARADEVLLAFRERRLGRFVADGAGV